MSPLPKPLPSLRSKLAAAALALSLVGCAAPGVEQYAQQKPALDLADYFAGTTQGWGMVQDWRGEVTRRFVVTIEGRFTGDEGSLDETFVWSDGERQKRVWRLKRTGPGRWVGSADDVVGTAQGEVQGNALRWQYTLSVPIDGRPLEIQFDDWMHLIDEEVMINKARMTKFGLPVGEVTLAFRRPSR
ncbi:MAG: hypothetical protein RLY30_585 [Pseudomonadota bacterium]|jgi:hypothetical protein